MANLVTTASVLKVFRFSGLTLRPDACQFLVGVANGEPEPQAKVQLLCTAVKERLKGDPIVDLMLLKEVVDDLAKTDEDADSERVYIVDAFSAPVMKWTPAARKYVPNPTGPKLFGTARDRIDLLRDRTALVTSRVNRSDLFTSATQGEGHEGADRIRLTPIDALVSGTGGPADVRHILGYVSQLEEGRFWLEDATGGVPLDLSKATVFHDALVSEGCVVIAVGYLELENEESALGKRRYVVLQLYSPVAEPRHIAEQRFPGSTRSFWGLPSLTPKAIEEMKMLELNATGSRFVIASDVHLDQPDVMRSLHGVCAGLQDDPPEVMVFMGNFSANVFDFADTSSEGQISPKEYGATFVALAQLLRQYPLWLERTHFVFVPGPRDPSASGSAMLPRPPLPQMFSKAFVEALDSPATRVSFTTNPSRLFFYLQEIVLFREDLVRKLQRHALCSASNPAEGTASDDLSAANVSEKVAKTVLDQAHLCPLPYAARPVYWSHEAALRLFPLPDNVVLADNYDQYQYRYNECGVMNPGSFASDGSFILYDPSTLTTHFCRYPGSSQQA